MIKKFAETGILVLLVISFMPVLAEDIHLEFVMPASMFGPGSPFYLDLTVENTGNAYSDAELFVALNVGTEDFWFYPSWALFPPDIDWEDVFVPANTSGQWVILPEFSWPSGAGMFHGAMFFAAILDNGNLVSNLAETQFGWSEEPPPVPEFVYIPSGTYTRGSPEDEPCRFDNESPLHTVTLTRSFNMMTTEVTRRMWADLKAFRPKLPDDPSDTSISPNMAHPVQQVTWNEAVLFANLMSLRDGLPRCYYKDAAFTVPVNASNYISGPFFCNFDANGYRLPTEAEWEYAARAGTTGPFSVHEPNYNDNTCGPCEPEPPLNVLDSIAWWCGNADGRAHRVGRKLPNPWGLYDMHGNISAWCWDWYGSYSSESVTNPTGASSGEYRVTRGGSWRSNARRFRSARRTHVIPDNRVETIGFRLVYSEESTPPTPTPTPPPAPPGYVSIVAGTYFRGSPEDEPCRSSDESPLRPVTLTRGFFMMETEVTRQMWADLKAVQPTLPDDPSDINVSSTMDHPVQRVTWYEAVLFANLMSLRDGLTRCYYTDDGYTTPVDASNYTTGPFYCDLSANGYRLPTEAEWEYAARAGTTEPFSTHEPNYSSVNCNNCSPSPPLEVLDNIAWWCGNSDTGSGAMAHTVGTKLPNPWGLYDMHGNVWEWCWDWYGDYPPGPATDPTGVSTGTHRVVRGGSWSGYAGHCRSANRSANTPSLTYINQGFRLVRSM